MASEVSSTKLASEVVGKAAHAVTHPRQTVTAVTGHARGLAATVTGSEQKAGEDGAEATTKATTGTPAYVSPDRNVEAAEPVPPATPVESSTDGPEVEINPATGRPHTRRGDDGPLIDPAVAKAVRSESEVMGRAADRDAEAAGEVNEH